MSLGVEAGLHAKAAADIADETRTFLRRNAEHFIG